MRVGAHSWHRLAPVRWAVGTSARARIEQAEERSDHFCLGSACSTWRAQNAAPAESLKLHVNWRESKKPQQLQTAQSAVVLLPPASSMFVCATRCTWFHQR
eukprot:360058-Chlamydomonas_euryale.AAC.2